MFESRKNVVGALSDLAKAIKKDIEDSWFFPRERHGPAGFCGGGPLMFIGDQPSKKNEWRECDRGRRLFYGKLCKYDLADAHLTDFYKKRGQSSALRNWKKDGLPSDWERVHKPILEQELAIVNPTRIVALSRLAYKLTEAFMPTLRPKLFLMLHFVDGIKPGRLHQFEASFTSACGIGPGTPAASISLKDQGLSETFSVRHIYGIGPKPPSDLNKQQTALLRTLADLCSTGEFVTAEVLERALNQREYLKTRQQPWRIWKYYENCLVRGGFVLSHCFAEI